MSASQKKVALLSTHDYESPRRAGFHWLADAYCRAGYQVDFVTVGLSPMSWLTGDHRLQRARTRGFNQIFDISPGMRGLYWLLPFHVVNLRSSWGNAATAPLFRLFGKLSIDPLKDLLNPADHIIVESSLALAFVPGIRKAAPRARLIYRVSDDVSVVGNHPVLSEFERSALPHFDLISLPSDYMRGKFGRSAPVEVHYHGIQKDLLDTQHDDPYEANGRRRVLTMGTTLFDKSAFVGFAEACPSVDFHFFGARNDLPQRDNICNHGERPFRELIPYIQHCDAGLAPYLPTPGAEYLSQTSNKLMQFTYCRKPVLVPSFIPSHAHHIVSYDARSSDDYPRQVSRAFSIGSADIDNGGICTWDDVRKALEQDEGVGL